MILLLLFLVKTKTGIKIKWLDEIERKNIKLGTFGKMVKLM